MIIDYLTLRLDLDMDSEKKVIKHLQEMLWHIFIIKYFEKPFFDFKKIDKIELIKKKSYSVKIHIKKEFSLDKEDRYGFLPFQYLIFLEIILLSDVKKQLKTLEDYSNGREQSNISFDVAKRYKRNKIIIAKKKDITKIIMKYLNKRLLTYEYNKKNNMINIQRKKNKLEVTYNPKKISKQKAIQITNNYQNALKNSISRLMKKLNE